MCQLPTLLSPIDSQSLVPIQPLSHLCLTVHSSAHCCMQASDRVLY